MPDLNKAAQVQSRLARRLELCPMGSEVRLVAGADCGYDVASRRIGAAVAVLSFPDLKLIETVHRLHPLHMPYIPGYLNFREGPALLRVLVALSSSPDVTFVDGNGIAHPRRMGLASYLGAVLNIPTIGCAKNPFYSCPAPGIHRGESTPILDKGAEKVGTCLRTRKGVKPVYVSPGNLIDFEQAERLTLACSRTRLPEPIRRAHSLASRLFA